MGPPAGAEKIPCHMSSGKQPSLEAGGSQPHQLVSQTAWGMEPEKYLFIFLSFLAFSNTLGVSLLPYPELHSLPCPWIMVPLALCLWMTLLGSTYHTTAILTLTQRPGICPDLCGRGLPREVVRQVDTISDLMNGSDYKG